MPPSQAFGAPVLLRTTLSAEQACTTPVVPEGVFDFHPQAGLQQSHVVVVVPDVPEVTAAVEKESKEAEAKRALKSMTSRSGSPKSERKMR